MATTTNAAGSTTTKMYNEKLAGLKRIAPDLAKLSQSSSDARAVFVAFLDRERSREITDLKMWHYTLTNKGCSVPNEHVALYDALQKRGMGEVFGKNTDGRYTFKFNIEYKGFLHIFRCLHDIGAGTYLESVDDSPPRFKWNYSIKHVALAAKKPMQVDSVIKKSNKRQPQIYKAIIERKKQAQALLKNRTVALFTQRNGESIRLEFPHTFTREERNRLAQFILTIPTN